MTAYLFKNGPIYPMGGAPIDDGALLTRGGEIAFVGGVGSLPPESRSATTVDLEGRPLFPGFYDSHLHLTVAALEHANLDCRACLAVEALQSLVRDRAAQTPPGEWITGSGWEKRTLFANTEPSLQALDFAAPVHPVLLVSKDWHSVWLNSAGLTRLLALPQLPPCTVERVAGAYTGLVYEEVFALRDLLLPKPTRLTKTAALTPFIEHLWRQGITGVHTMESYEDLPLVAAHLGDSSARVRVVANLMFDSPAQLRTHAAALHPYPTPWLQLGGVKLFADGSFGSLTAALTVPYQGRSDCGLLTLDATALDDWLAAIGDAQTHGVFHAIGDRALQLVLDGLRRHLWPAATRHRLEHAQILSAAAGDIRGLVFSGQPSHLWADREIIPKHFPRTLHSSCYAYRTMLTQGAELVFGSDAPVETVDPWPGIRAAVTRVATQNSEPFGPEQSLTLTEALAAHTSTPGKLNRFPMATGVLQPGAAADLVVLDRNPYQTTVDSHGQVRVDNEAWQLQADMTWVDGELVFTR